MVGQNGDEVRRRTERLFDRNAFSIIPARKEIVLLGSERPLGEMPPRLAFAGAEGG
jgi:hypothetical protein